MSLSSENTHWMVRKNDMRIFRPIPQAELIEKIVAGEIEANDELCPGNGYWFTLSEVNEVRAHLGDVDLACLHSKDFGGENTASTTTRPIQRTSIIVDQIVLESPPIEVKVEAKAETVEVKKVEPVVRSPIQPVVHAAPVPVAVAESQMSQGSKVRAKNALGVALVFFVFLAILVWIWSGSY
jgi:hypothetical protein